MPASLDWGSLKLDDLELDLEHEVALLRAIRGASPAAPDPAPRA